MKDRLRKRRQSMVIPAKYRYCKSGKLMVWTSCYREGIVDVSIQLSDGSKIPLGRVRVDLGPSSIRMDPSLTLVLRDDPGAAVMVVDWMPLEPPDGNLSEKQE